MKLRIEKPAIVITPTIGQESLHKAIQSVSDQSYENLKHLVVVDGPDFLKNVSDLNISEYYTKLQVTVAPENTGRTGGNFWGHRIFAAYPHLVNADYILFLDEDNWFDNNHVETLIEYIEHRNLDWAYSLRNIYTKEETFVDSDCCESLGRWPVFWSLDKSDKEYLVDTSAYCFKREFLIHVCQHWHSGWGGDRKFYKIITQLLKHDKFGTTGMHTMNYRLDDSVEKKYGNINFFSEGNKIVKQHYGEYPWKKT